ncbi:pathogenesis-related thaumatin-like protein 3.5 [Rhododendron vialii]|uniref:pathogenesis-related thaumatin-like protein 3.5 n=1 Tax=Rhododendron vialii TaxID=182163 RepID=UPI00265F01F2|nr:pathogenesis-related thaumatin-like protein 3.5 [Rhododendron vialii]
MALFLLSPLLVFTFLGGDATVFTLQNRCTTKIWPGIAGPPVKPELMDNGVALSPSQTINISAPAGWSGDVWARTGCSFDKAGGVNCTSGNCDGSIEECGSIYSLPLATFANFLLDDQFDSYAINLVEGFNIPISIVPSGGSGDCRPVRCLTDLNIHCPSKLQVRRNGRVVACKSACTAFKQPEYCCTAAYDNPNGCKPSSYSKFFKDSCPAAYTSFLDNPTSIFTCKGADYLISFC